MARETGDRAAESAILANLGVAYFDVGDALQGSQRQEQALVIARETGEKTVEASVLWNMSLQHEKIGDRPRAVHHAREALRIMEENEDPLAAIVRKKLVKWERG